ncbi:MAG: carboxypeptidase-like regulatory domain-containing protein [Agriterribacter sp.]
MKNKILNIVITIMFSAGLAACSKQNNDNGIPSGTVVTKGVVSGRVTDVKNLPVKEARITIEHTVWNSSYLFSSSDNDGTYRVSLPDDPAGDWTAKAQLIKTAYGQTYKFDLEPDKNDVFTKASGAVRNFIWKLTGSRAGSVDYYGAHVDLYPFGGDVDMTKVILLFTPFPGEANYIDGTPFSSFERPVEDIGGIFMVKDVPIGKYTVKLVYTGKKLLLNNRHIDDDDEETKMVVFGKYGYLGETEYNIEFYVTEQK